MKARLHELALAARGSCNLFQEHVCTIFCREGAEGKDLILVTPHDPRTPEYTPGVAERQRRLLMSSFRKQNAHFDVAVGTAADLIVVLSKPEESALRFCDCAEICMIVE